MPTQEKPLSIARIGDAYINASQAVKEEPFDTNTLCAALNSKEPPLPVETYELARVAYMTAKDTLATFAAIKAMCLASFQIDKSLVMPVKS